MTGMLAIMLLLQFRVMDDISDVHNDRIAHPERVMSKTPSLKLFYIMLFSSFVTNLVLVTMQPGPEHRIGVFLLLNAVAILWYRYVRVILTDKVLGYHIVIGKYPVFVYLLSGAGFKIWPLFLAISLVYTCFSIYEALHDRSLHNEPGIIITVNLEVVALFAVSALMTIVVIGSNPIVVFLQCIMSVAVLLAFLKILCFRQVNLSSLNTGYAVFIIGIAMALNFSIGVRL